MCSRFLCNLPSYSLRIEDIAEIFNRKYQTEFETTWERVGCLGLIDWERNQEINVRLMSLIEENVALRFPLSILILQMLELFTTLPTLESFKNIGFVSIGHQISASVAELSLLQPDQSNTSSSSYETYLLFKPVCFSSLSAFQACRPTKFVQLPQTLLPPCCLTRSSHVGPVVVPAP